MSSISLSGSTAPYFLYNTTYESHAANNIGRNKVHAATIFIGEDCFETYPLDPQPRQKAGNNQWHHLMSVHARLPF